MATQLYESQIEEFLIKQPSLIEDGFKFLESQKQTKVGRIDIFGKDQYNNYVVVEIKRDRSSDRVIGQITRYIGAICEDYEISKDSVRGIIICEEISEKLRLASSVIDNLKLITYNGFKIKPREKTDKKTFKLKKRVNKIGNRNQRRYSVKIPTDLVDEMGWKKGDRLYLAISPDGSIIAKNV